MGEGLIRERLSRESPRNGENMDCLTEKFFYWPYSIELTQAVEDIYPVLKKSALNPWLDPATSNGNLAEYIALTCRLWNINPGWVLVTAQREQSALTTLPGLFRNWSKNAWLGFVGQDVGHVTRPGWYGVYTQVQRCVPQTAWLLGDKNENAWSPFKPATSRYYPGVRLGIEKDGQQVDYYADDAGVYTQLAYTPHWKVLESNYKIAKNHLPEWMIQC